MEYVESVEWGLEKKNHGETKSYEEQHLAKRPVVYIPAFKLLAISEVDEANQQLVLDFQGLDRMAAIRAEPILSIQSRKETALGLGEAGEVRLTEVRPDMVLCGVFGHVACLQKGGKTGLVNEEDASCLTATVAVMVVVMKGLQVFISWREIGLLREGRGSVRRIRDIGPS